MKYAVILLSLTSPLLSLMQNLTILLTFLYPEEQHVLDGAENGASYAFYRVSKAAFHPENIAFNFFTLLESLRRRRSTTSFKATRAIPQLSERLRAFRS